MALGTAHWGGSRSRWQATAVITRVFDPWILAAVLVLVGLGLLNLVAMGMTSLAVRHGAAVVLGSLVLIALARLRVQTLPRLAWGGYLLAVALLLGVLVAGQTVKGAQRWLDLGVLSVQPSELAKLTVLVLLAHLLARGYTRLRLVGALGLAAIPVGLIALQPDLSTALVVAAIVGFLVVLARVPLLPIAAIFAAVLAALPLALLLLRPYQLGRLEAFASGARDSSGPGWAALQAEIAVAGGGLFGRWREPLFDLRSSYLPEREHDLAFASVIHGWGLLAGIAVVAAVLVLVWRAALASRLARSREAALISAGVAALFGLHAVISIAANLTLLPHTGLPIPLFSYGGTTAVVHFAALGLVLAARRDGLDYPLWAPPARNRLHPRWARAGALVLSVNLAAMSWFAWHTQTARGDQLRGASEEQMTRCLTLPAERGVITDHEGTELVRNEEQHEVYVVPGLFPTGDTGAVERLAGLLEQEPEELTETIAAEPELHAEVATLDPADAEAVTAAGLPGVFVTPAQQRDYPHEALLGPMLGFTGVATPADMLRWPSLSLGSVVGRTGLEQQYDALLRGTDGAQCVYVDPHGTPVAAKERTDPVAGQDLRLHLDLDLQRTATEALSDAVADSGGDLGGAVAMDARTGAILAMASVPSYDNNVYTSPVDTEAVQAETERPGLPTLDHVSQVAAAPGSTYKLVVAAANAAHDAVPPERVVPTGASFSLGGHTFRNWRPMGPHNLVEALAQSDNVYFYKLALELGPDKLAAVADELGVGRPTGIDLPGESAGFLGTPESVGDIGGEWFPGSTVLSGIGQGPITATPLHNARWTAALASGALVTPQLAAASGSSAAGNSPSGNSEAEIRAAEPQPLSFASDLAAVREGMDAAVSHGTAARLGELPVPVGAKTGTAEDPASVNGEPHAWIGAVAPSDDPEIVVSVFVRGGGSGSGTAGPVAHAMLEHYLEHRAELTGEPGEATQ